MENLEHKLVEEKWLQPWQLDMARLDAVNSGKSIWATVIKLGFLSEENIVTFLALQSGIPYVRLEAYAVSPAVLHLLEENFCLQNAVIPLFQVGTTLFVACSNPLNTALIDSLTKATNCTIEPLVASAHSILAALDLYWKLDDKNFQMSELIVKPPQAMQGMGQWRESERKYCQVPLVLAIVDEAVALISPCPLEGFTLNISADGSAAGIQVPLFLPKGITVAVSFKLLPEAGTPRMVLEARGEILRTSMLGDSKYLLGVKFTRIEEETRKQLMEIASK